MCIGLDVETAGNAPDVGFHVDRLVDICVLIAGVYPDVAQNAAVICFVINAAAVVAEYFAGGDFGGNYSAEAAGQFCRGGRQSAVGNIFRRHRTNDRRLRLGFRYRGRFRFLREQPLFVNRVIFDGNVIFVRVADHARNDETAFGRVVVVRRVGKNDVFRLFNAAQHIENETGGAGQIAADVKNVGNVFGRVDVQPDGGAVGPVTFQVDGADGVVGNVQHGVCQFNKLIVEKCFRFQHQRRIGHVQFFRVVNSAV